MKSMVLISRHDPTLEQRKLAAEAGYQIVSHHDIDGFDTHSLLEVALSPASDCVAVVHAGAALALMSNDVSVAVFRNENRAPVGQPSTFKASELHIYHPSGSRHIIAMS